MTRTLTAWQIRVADHYRQGASIVEIALMEKVTWSQVNVALETIRKNAPRLFAAIQYAREKTER